MSSQPIAEASYYNPDDGWMFFAGSVLGIAGIMRIFDSIWAFSYGGALPDGLEGALFGKSLTTYGWVWLIVGVILIGASFAVLVKSQFARWFGIVAGALMAISAMWWIAYYPVWSLVYVLVGVFVVYALGAHGARETPRG